MTERKDFSHVAQGVFGLADTVRSYADNPGGVPAYDIARKLTGIGSLPRGSYVDAGVELTVNSTAITVVGPDRHAYIVFNTETYSLFGGSRGDSAEPYWVDARKIGNGREGTIDMWPRLQKGI